MNEILQNKNLQTGVAVVIGFGSGMALGYYLGKKAREVVAPAVTNVFNNTPEGDVDDLLTNEDIALRLCSFVELERGKVRDRALQLMRLYDPSIDAPQDEVVVETVEEVVEETIVVEGPDEEPEAKVINIFYNPAGDDWDYEKELEGRGQQPYVIHQDEYFGNEQDFTQKTYTYYAGDNILVDDKDTPVHRHENVVGELKFGHGTTDKNTVYIRNPMLEMEFEILRMDGLYSEEVMGVHPEPEAERRSTRLRDDD